MFNDLREFINELEKRGELKKINLEVDPELEITEIADRTVKSEGPALFFENVKGTFSGKYGNKIPLVINLFGTKKRMALALGVEDLNDVGKRISEMLNLKVPENLLGKLALLPKLKDFTNFPPKMVKSAPCQEIVLEGDEVDLNILPVIKCWPIDAGKYITLPLVITKDPETGIRNVGMYRLQIFDRNSTGMHWQRHKGSARHYDKAKKLGKKMEVAVALGGDPAMIYSASAPLPESIEEFLFAGFLRNKPIELVKCLTIDMEVPANSEIILEGYVDPSEPERLEGPFGDHTGYYSLADYYPTFHITTITMRKNPIYSTIIVGKPPMEDYWLGHATERIFLPLAKMVLSEIVDYHMPPEGVFHNLVFVSIDKQYPGHAYKVMNGLWGMGQMMLAKVIVVVDKDVNIHDHNEVWWTVLNNIDPQRDIRFTPGPVDVLDHSSQYFSFGTKMGIDATRKWKEEGFNREWPDKIVMTEEVKKKIDRIWKELGI
jgi:4-hydroxy-3-polyprenylbenzoate decarboxylase